MEENMMSHVQDSKLYQELQVMFHMSCMVYLMILIVPQVAAEYFKKWPIHVAALLGNKERMRELLQDFGD
jgi:hypothetical protein